MEAKILKNMKMTNMTAMMVKVMFSRTKVVGGTVPQIQIFWRWFRTFFPFIFSFQKARTA